MLHQIRDEHVREKIYRIRLQEQYGYSEDQIKHEVPQLLGQRRFVTDLIVFKENTPYIIVEVKSNLHTSLSLKDRLIQISSVLNNSYAVITDGLDDICFRIVRHGSIADLENVNDIPTNDSLTNTQSKQLKITNSLVIQSILYRSLELLENSSYHLRSSEIIEEFCKILACKIYADSLTKKKQLYSLDEHSTKNNILSLLEKAIQKYGFRFTTTTFHTANFTLQQIITNLEKCIILASHIGHQFIDDLSTKRFMKSAGEFVTPHSIASIVVDFVNPKPNTKVLDISCGTGQLLIEAAKHGALPFGIDINVEVVNLAKINLLLNVGDIGNVYNLNSLMPLQELKIRTKNNIQPESFDTIVTHLPFGLKYLEHGYDFELSKLISGITNAEAFFIERSWQLLKNNGKLAIVLPESILTSQSMYAVRKFIIEHFKILSMISLPSGAFFPLTQAKASILILEKTKLETTKKSYQIFVAELNSQDLKDNQIDKLQIIVNKFNEFLKSGKSKYKIQLDDKDELRFDIEYFKNQEKIRHISVETIHLSDIAQLTVGLKGSKTTPETKGCFFVKGQNIKELKLDLSTSEKIHCGDLELDKFGLRFNDLVMARSGSVGSIAIFRESVSAIVSDNLIRLRVQAHSRILPEYLLLILYSDFGQSQIRQQMTGTTIKGISVSNLGKILIPLIPLEEQHRIIANLYDLFRQKEKLDEVTKEYNATKSKITQLIDNTIMGGLA